MLFALFFLLPIASDPICSFRLFGGEDQPSPLHETKT
jgi:hypothetical protein